MSGATLSRPAAADVRARFPALAGPTVFLENAGGSQVPRDVPERMHEYLRSTFVQLGAGYPLSRRCSAVMDEAHDFVATLTNAPAPPILGASSSILLRLLADAWAERIEPGDEVVVAETGHESNVGPWLRLERAGARLRWWRVDPRTAECPLDALQETVSPRTVLVAFPHVSNLLGGVVDVPAVVRIAKEAGARVVVDGVAYAPHRAVDVAGWGADWYALSLYKIYGPHLGALVGTPEAMAEIPGWNHFFVPEDEIPYRYELGGVSHEAAAGLLGTRDYLAWLAGAPDLDRAGVERAFARMDALEAPLTGRLLGWLAAREGVRVVGPSAADASRVGTVSFVHERVPSSRIVAATDAADVGIRHGHMYAYRLCERLGLDPGEGVVRVSLVHYNADSDLDRLFDVLDGVL